jgi:peptide deformylase
MRRINFLQPSPKTNQFGLRFFSSCCNNSKDTQLKTNLDIQIPSSSILQQQQRFHTSTATPNNTADFKMPNFNANPSGPKYPIVQLPAESLWCHQNPVMLNQIKTRDFQHMLQRLKDSRSFYQYPSMSAPQIGWNVSVFVLYDGSVWINPKYEKGGKNADTMMMCWAWEPCASCCFLMHYIQRPHECVVSRYDETGKFHEGELLDGMKSRMVQHEMDHLNGVLFSRRIPNNLHVVPMDGFNTMSDWAEDYPSIEARSTNLYSLFFPPHTVKAHYLEDSELLKRHYEDNIFPGFEVVEESSREEARHNELLQQYIETQKKAGLWKGSQFSQNRRPRTSATMVSPNTQKQES